MNATQIEEFRKWVEEKSGRSAEIRINFSYGKPTESGAYVFDLSLCGQPVKSVDEIDLEGEMKRRIEEMQRALDKEEK